MKSQKIIPSLIISLAFWFVSALVLVSVFNNHDLTGTAVIKTAVNDEQTFTAIGQDITPDKEVTAEIPFNLISGEIRQGESFDLAMKRLKVDDSVRAGIISGFSSSLDFRTLQPGDQFSIELDQDNIISRAIYQAGQLNRHILQKSDNGVYQSARQAVPLEYRVERLSATINSSLYAAFSRLGEEPKLIHAYADIFASKIDFNTETRTGDRFELLVEKYYKDEVFVGYGKILVASYLKQDTVYQGYHFASEETPSGYFDENGEALGTWFIRSPIPFGRVTSRFTMRRKHPIDGVVRPHLGIDLAAPRGTPVLATAEGRVEFVGRKGGFGKTIILNHHGGYKTYYGHLNRYAKGLKRGDTVQQKDIIGYVGSTGISTGPHLDYRIKYNGVYRNPFGIKFKAKTVLNGDELDKFLMESSRIAELFKNNSDRKILQVKNITLTEENIISFL
jgi:murein DD-endopeptidase MepM/ murein hydrolase activator NlpD